MAKRVEVILVDDIDGSPAHETVKFALDATSYEIDLSAANAAQLREVLAPYVGAGRSATVRKVRTKTSAPAVASAAQVRTWAAANGFEVSERGRIPAHVRKAYELAHA